MMKNGLYLSGGLCWYLFIPYHDIFLNWRFVWDWLWHAKYVMEVKKSKPIFDIISCCNRSSNFIAITRSSTKKSTKDLSILKATRAWHLGIQPLYALYRMIVQHFMHQFWCPWLCCCSISVIKINYWSTELAIFEFPECRHWNLMSM